MREPIDTKHENLVPMSDKQYIDHLKSRPKEAKINAAPQKKVDTVNLQLKSDLPDFSVIKQRRDGEILDELKEQTKELQGLRYENIKLNAQLTTANQLKDEANSKVDELASEITTIKNDHRAEIERLKKEARVSFWQTAISSLIIGVITGLILMWCAIIWGQYY